MCVRLYIFNCIFKFCLRPATTISADDTAHHAAAHKNYGNFRLNFFVRYTFRDKKNADITRAPFSNDYTHTTHIHTCQIAFFMMVNVFTFNMHRSLYIYVLKI